MRKLIVSMNITLDGFMAGPNCELDWHFRFWNEEMAHSLSEQLSHADTIILGGVTYRGLAGYLASNPVSILTSREDIDFIDMLNTYTKVVFSRTMPTVTWNNARLAKKDIAAEVTELKAQPGRAIIIYGSGKIVRALYQLNLIDEYRLWVHPVVIGKGKPLFNELHQASNLALFKTERFSSGVVVLYYEVKKQMAIDTDNWQTQGKYEVRR